MTGLFILLGTAFIVLIVLMTAMLAWEMRHPPRHTAAYALAKGMACDPGDLNPSMKFEEWWLDRPDGVSLAVWETVNPKSKIQNPKSSPTAVFIHGWGHSRIDSLTRIGPFLPMCDRIVLYDLRGHGESRGGSSTLGQHEDDDLLALLERLGDSHFLLVGHSMGAVIAITAAAKAAQSISSRICGIVAYGPYSNFHQSLCGRLRTKGYSPFFVTRLAMVVHRLCGIVPLSLNGAEVAKVGCPMLVIHGTEDQIAPFEDGRRITDAAPNGSWHPVASASHVDAHLIDPASHDQVVVEFIERIARENTTDGEKHSAHPIAAAELV